MSDQVAFVIICFPLFLLAIMLHEIAHGWVALKHGDPTAKYAGRLSLNPIVHVDPIGIVVYIFTSFVGAGFGWAKPVPINPLLFKEYRKGIIQVSLAGVAANLLQVIATAIIAKILIVAGLGDQGRVSELLFKALGWYMQLNVVLIVFNLIPVPPLDGSKVLMMLLPRDTAIAFARLERFGFIIIFALLFFNLLNPLFGLASMILSLGLGWLGI